MDLRDLESILTIAEEGSISHAAAKLYVTPSALTQLIQRTEKSIGTPLFNRGYNGCSLTEAGAIYVKTAKQMLQLKHEAMIRIQDTSSSPSVTLTVAFPPEHGVNMLTAVYPHFNERFPDVHLKIHEISVRKQQQGIADGTIDLGFVTLRDDQRTGDEYIPLVDEELLIALPADAAPCAMAVEEPGSRFPVLDPSALNGYPFAQLYEESTFRTWTDSIFEAAGVAPLTIMEASRPRTILRMVDAGLCGGMATDYHYNLWSPRERIRFFSLPDHPKWQVLAFYRKGGYLSKPMEYLIALAKEFWSEQSEQLKDGNRI